MSTIRDQYTVWENINWLRHKKVSFLLQAQFATEIKANLVLIREQYRN